MKQNRLGPLAIASKLGDHPSQSSVWRASHVSLERVVAVKVFSAPFGATPEARSQFVREWERLQKIQHPAIARCYGGGFEGANAYLAYELVEGETLSEHLERRTRLAWDSVLDMAGPIADALKYLHEQGVAYGRLDLDKIMIVGFSPLLLDMRIDHQSPFRTNRRVDIRDLALMPPEILDDGKGATPSSDLYCLGAVLYKALTGRPPVDGDTVEEVRKNLMERKPAKPSSIVLECPVWLDQLVMQMLEKDPNARPHGASAVTLALAEVRRRALSRASVAEHLSAGFSPLNVTDQEQREEARQLLGKDAVSIDQGELVEAVPWHERPMVLVGGLLTCVAVFLYAIWPLSEGQMQQRAEQLLAENTRNARNQAKVAYLQPMLEKYPDGEHAGWAREQLAHVEMLQAEHALSVKQKRNLPLSNEGERLYVEANDFERFGDTASALSRYRSLETLLADNPDYRPFVDLARRQISLIETSAVEPDEASVIIQTKLAEAEQLQQSGKEIAARKIWYSIVDLYANNQNATSLVAEAQQRLESVLPRSANTDQQVSRQEGAP